MFGKKRITSVEQFLNEVYSYRMGWGMEPDKELWFRGESHADYRTALRPRLYRPERTTDVLLDLEDKLWQEFKRCGVQLATAEHPTDDFEWYSLMQHYGGPTRLLDWSDGALIALHFAVSDRGYSRYEPDAVVYVLDSYWLTDELPEPTLSEKDATIFERLYDSHEGDEANLFLPRGKEDRAEVPLPAEPMVLDFDHFAKRVAAQRSRFLVLGRDADWVRRQIDRKDSRLRAIRVDGSAVARIQEELRTCGVTESVIFPDLDGLGREISSLWRRITSHP